MISIFPLIVFLLLLTKISTDLKVANLTLDPSEDWLYLASDHYFIRLKIYP